MLKHAWLFRYSYTCQPMDYSDDPDEVAVAYTTWWYFFAKFTEFLDTVFFVLRKKNDQITALHVIHHSVMPAFSWYGVKFTPGGHCTLFILINSFIHVVMYTYYLLAAMGPKYQKYLWWKKHLTAMQLVQFTVVFSHNALALINGCNYSINAIYVQCFMSMVFLGLFSNFYIQVLGIHSRFSYKRYKRFLSRNLISSYYFNLILGLH